FAGNTHDARTLRTIVATMEARHGMLGRVWIADRGMASAGNLAWLQPSAPVVPTPPRQPPSLTAPFPGW
ncbi:MAG TPA: hypothetical protein VGI78_30460, partial [Acetobacteraceae bacterium]